MNRAEPNGTSAERLTDECSGRWFVHTHTARYDINLDTRQILRHPDPEAASGQGQDGPPVASLRRDEAPIKLLHLYQCRLGQPMILLLDLVGDGTITIRTTTYVQRIHPAAGSPSASE